MFVALVIPGRDAVQAAVLLQQLYGLTEVAVTHVHYIYHILLINIKSGYPVSITADPLINDLRFSSPDLSGHFLEVKNNLFPRLADIKAPLAEDKPPLTVDKSTYARLYRCPNLLCTSKRQFLA